MRKILRFILALIGLAIGCGIVSLILYNVKFPGFDYTLAYTTETYVLIGAYVLGGFIAGLILFTVSGTIVDAAAASIDRIERKLSSIPTIDILFGSIGMILGMLIAYLLTLAIKTFNVPSFTSVASVVLYLILGFLGLKIGISRRDEFFDEKGKRSFIQKQFHSDSCPKVLDTSAIIDGRIFDIVRTGFLEGKLIIPAFVLHELRHIADSSDLIKRNRGRRGLDLISELQKEYPERVIVDTRDYEEPMEVDTKLLRLASDLSSPLVTTDYNLNKVASVQNTQVLNVNDLARAVHLVLLPEEVFELTIVKEGKESGQGIGYLDDGTMVIVEGGRHAIGMLVSVTVTSVLQTSAGRMIFAKLKGKEQTGSAEKGQ